MPTPVESVRLGSEGEMVALIQKKLGLTSDGVFGKVTQKSVMEWQMDHGLTPDGIVGPQTMQKMIG